MPRERDEPTEEQKRGVRGSRVGVGSPRPERVVINLKKFNRTKPLISMMVTERFVLIIGYYP